MKVIKINKWIPINDVDHVATQWQISNNVDFTSTLLDTGRDEDRLNILTTNLVPLPGVTYYVRYKRFFSDDTESPWTKPKGYTVELDSSVLLLHNDVIIDTPMIYVDKEELLGNGDVTIRTSKYRGRGDGHFSTNYVITDLYGNVIFSRLNDDVNKTSITISTTGMGLNNYNKFMIKASHKAGSGIESEFGSKIIVVDNFNFVLVNDVNRIIPYDDFEITFKKINENIVEDIVNVKLIDMQTGFVYLDRDIADNNVIIPGDILEPNKQFYLNVTTNSQPVPYEKNIVLNVIGTKQNNDVNHEFQYAEKYKFIYNHADANIVPSITTNEMYNGVVPFIVNNNTSVFEGKYDSINNKFITSNIQLHGVSLLKNTEGVFIRFTNSNKLIIDNLNSDDKPTFMVFDYNPSTKVFNLVHSLTRDDETLPIGVNNGFAFVGDKDMFYLTPDTGVIKKYNYFTNELEVVKELNIPNFEQGTMLNIGNARLLIIGGDSKDSVLYDLNKNTVEIGAAVPLAYRGKHLKSFPLLNGDFIIHITNHNDDEDDVSFMKFDYEKSDLIQMEDVASNGAYPDICINTISGELLLGKPSTNNTIFYNYA